MKLELSYLDRDKIERKLYVLEWLFKMCNFWKHEWTKEDVFFIIDRKDELVKPFDCETGRLK